jgi:hypothetical protein
MPISLADPGLRVHMEAFALIQINAGEAPGAFDRGDDRRQPDGQVRFWLLQAVSRRRFGERGAGGSPC